MLRNLTRSQHFDLANKHWPTWVLLVPLIHTTLDSSGSGLLHPDLKVAAARYTDILEMTRTNLAVSDIDYIDYHDSIR